MIFYTLMFVGIVFIFISLTMTVMFAQSKTKPKFVEEIPALMFMALLGIAMLMFGMYGITTEGCRHDLETNMMADKKIELKVSNKNNRERVLTDTTLTSTFRSLKRWYD